MARHGTGAAASASADLFYRSKTPDGSGDRRGTGEGRAAPSPATPQRWRPAENRRVGRTNAAKDTDVARRLWEVSDEFVSERLTGVWAYQPHFAPWVTFWVKNVTHKRVPDQA